MAVGIRRTPGVQVTPQTASGGGRRPSALEGLSSLANALGGLGTAMQRFSALRNDRKFAQETSKANAYWLSTNDQFETIASQVSATDLEGLNAALVEPTDAAVKWAEEHLTTDRAKAAFFAKLEEKKNELQRPRMRAQGEALAKKQVDDAYRVAAQHTTAPYQLGQDLQSPEPGVRHTARLALKNAEDQFLGPESVLVARFGIPAATQAYAKYMTETGRAAGMAWLDSVSLANLPEAYKQYLAQGAPDADHKDRFYGAEDTWEERRQTIEDHARQRRLADTLRDGEIKRVEGELKDKQDAYRVGVYAQIASGAPVDFNQVLASAPDPTDTQLIQIAKDIRNGTWETNAQRIAGEQADRQIEDSISFIGTSHPGALGELSMERDGVMARTDLHYKKRAELVGELTEAMGEARAFTGLTPKQQERVKILDTWSKVMHPPRDTPISLQYTADQLSQIQTGLPKINHWFRAKLADSTFDDRAALDIAQAAALELQAGANGDMMAALVDAFDTPESVARIREEPAAVLEAFPSVRQDLIVFAGAGREPGRKIDFKRTVANLMKHGLGQGMGDFDDTLIAMRFIERHGHLQVFHDPAAQARVVSAQAAAAAASQRARAPVRGGTQGAAILPQQPRVRGATPP